MTAYNISTYAGLKTIKDDLAGDYTLTANIDCSDSKTENYSGGIYNGFPPIGDDSTEFTGTFNGGGYTLSNLYINRPATNFVGLFGKIQKTGTANDIKNVTLFNFDITGNSSVGLLAGDIAASTSDSVITSVVVSGKITANSSSVGGLIGSTSGVTCTSCSADVVITATGTTAYNIGGLIGSYTNTDCTSCSSSGAITASGTVSGGGGIGGLLGHGQTGASAITSCYSSVAVIDNCITTGAYASSIGGFVGWDDTATCSLCFASGSVISTNTYIVYAGGFVGQGQGSYTKCYATGNIDATAALTSANMGGFIGINACTTLNNCYSRGDVGKLGISTGTYVIGGFTGNVPAGITIGKCYSTGYVNQSAGSVGGFCASGTASKSQVTCLWDTDTSGILTSFGTSPAVGKTTAELKTQTTTSSAPFSFDYSTVWQMGTTVTPAFLGSNITVWPSKTGDYENFKEGTKDDDSFSLVIPSQNEIRWLGALESLLLGTAGDEWKIGSNKLETPLTPTNFAVKQQSEHGSNQVQPMKINASLLFVNYVSRKLREMTYVDPKYDSPDMTALAEHITYSGITSIARQKNPDSILWFTLGDGSLISMTYERDQNVIAWSKHPMTDAFVQSVCVVPEATEDAVYISVQRTLDGEQVYYGDEPVYYGDEPVYIGIGTVTYIEKMAPRVFTELTDAHFIDCGISFETSGAWVDEPVLYGTEAVYYGTEPVVYSVFYTTAATSTITGLDHLNGETVQVLGDGVALDNEVVSDGKITPHLNGVVTSVFKAHVGRQNTPMIQPMRIVLGDSMGSITHVSELVISLLETGSLKYGKKTTEMIEADLTDPRWTNTCTKAGLFTGEIVVSMPGGFDVLNPIFISTDKPLPLTVRAIVPRIERTGR